MKGMFRLARILLYKLDLIGPGYPLPFIDMGGVLIQVQSSVVIANRHSYRSGCTGQRCIKAVTVMTGRHTGIAVHIITDPGLTYIIQNHLHCNGGQLNIDTQSIERQNHIAEGHRHTAGFHLIIQNDQVLFPIRIKGNHIIVAALTFPKILLVLIYPLGRVPIRGNTSVRRSTLGPLPSIGIQITESQLGVNGLIVIHIHRNGMVWHCGQLEQPLPSVCGAEIGRGWCQICRIILFQIYLYQDDITIFVVHRVALLVPLYLTIIIVRRFNQSTLILGVGQHPNLCSFCIGIAHSGIVIDIGRVHTGDKACIAHAQIGRANQKAHFMDRPLSDLDLCFKVFDRVDSGIVGSINANGVSLIFPHCQIWRIGNLESGGSAGGQIDCRSRQDRKIGITRSVPGVNADALDLDIPPVSQGQSHHLLISITNLAGVENHSLDFIYIVSIVMGVMNNTVSRLLISQKQRFGINGLRLIILKFHLHLNLIVLGSGVLHPTKPTVIVSAGKRLTGLGFIGIGRIFTINHGGAGH